MSTVFAVPTSLLEKLADGVPLTLTTSLPSAATAALPLIVAATLPS